MMGAATAAGVSEATAYRHVPDLPSLLRGALPGCGRTPPRRNLQCFDLCWGQGLLEDLDVVDTAGEPADVLRAELGAAYGQAPAGGVGGGVGGGALRFAVDVEPQLAVGGVVDADEVDPGVQGGRAGG